MQPLCHKLQHILTPSSSRVDAWSGALKGWPSIYMWRVGSENVRGGKVEKFSIAILN